MKRIVTCSDGTWNFPGEKDCGITVQTNVQKLHIALKANGTDNTPTVKFYDPGVGTAPTVEDEILGGAIGDGMNKNIVDAYKFIVWNYEHGDQIFLFGFSRGAYTARSLSGLIRYCGILKPGNIHLAQEAFQLYHDHTQLTDPDSDVAATFRKQYSFETNIRFIGVWDTVGSLGIPLKVFKKKNAAKYLFHDVTLSSKVDFAYHALAINERRELFEPTLWDKSETVKNNTNHAQKMEQVWFAGVHSNIGGGYFDSGLSDISLEWMMDKAGEVGLAFDINRIKGFKPNAHSEMRNSLKWYYRILGGPKWRKVCDKTKDRNESIHHSVHERYGNVRQKLPPNLKGLLSK